MCVSLWIKIFNRNSEKLNHYVFENNFVVESSNKHFEAIFNINSNKCPLHLQRMRICLQKHNFTINYKLGKKLTIADALSRLFLEEKCDPFEEKIEAHVCAIRDSK